MISPTLKQATSHPTDWLDDFDPSRRILRGEDYLFAKRVMDLTLIVLFSPLILLLLFVCALLIKLDSPDGPIFFVQTRTGRGGQPFQMVKFRTMVPNAEAMKRQLAHLNELQWPDFKITDDPRVTRVGCFLRRTSLDELPQVWNVLLGQMSLVGPRPTSFSARTYELWQTERLDVMPGITGLWQLWGRASTEFDQRLRLDIAYIERRCLWLDVQILLRTLPAILARRGAH